MAHEQGGDPWKVPHCSQGFQQVMPVDHLRPPQLAEIVGDGHTRLRKLLRKRAQLGGVNGRAMSLGNQFPSKIRDRCFRAGAAGEVLICQKNSQRSGPGRKLQPAA